MKYKFLSIWVVLSVKLAIPVLSADVLIELVMPETGLVPGSTMKLDLSVANTGPALTSAQLYVALTLGTSEYWFYPGWVHFPPGIDYKAVDIPSASSDILAIIPEFPWPDGAGSFSGAMFYSAILEQGALVSNLAQITFHWAEPPDGFVYIPPGSFLMGARTNEPCLQEYETPIHEVILTRGFYMMKTEVTRKMWEQLRSHQPDLPEDPSDTGISPTLDYPVQNATWYVSVLYANLLSLEEGLTRCYYRDAAYTIPIDKTNYNVWGEFHCRFDANGYRLPTEAEWEYACRAGTETPFSFDEPNLDETKCNDCTNDLPALDAHCAYCGNCIWIANIAGAKLSNPWGLYDMHGNVSEWSWNWDDFYSAETQTDPTGRLSGSDKIFRGGSWQGAPWVCRSAFRYAYAANSVYYTVGFRLVRTVL